MTPELRAVIDRLEVLAAEDPRLDQYRTTPNPEALSQLPDGWQLSEDMTWLIRESGWWPGQFYVDLGSQADFMADDPKVIDDVEQSVQWFNTGAVGEKDFCVAPALRSVEPSAPVLMWCEAWTSMVFPTEASLLEAFVITYETCGMDESIPDYPWVVSSFVEWVLDPPALLVSDEGVEAHRRIAERSASWETSHPTWHHETMPFLSTGFSLDVRAEAALYGVSPDQIRQD